MKKGIVFFLGVLTGVVIIVIAAIVLSRFGDNLGITYYDEPGEVLSFRTVKVCQSYQPGAALVSESGYASFEDQMYLLVTKDKKAFYDGETVKVPTGQMFRVVGVYSYQMSEGRTHTVPAITIMGRE